MAQPKAIPSSCITPGNEARVEPSIPMKRFATLRDMMEFSRSSYLKRVLPACDETLIPEHMRQGLAHYIDCGVLHGGFLQAILEGDMEEASALADSTNKAALGKWHGFLIDYAPWQCWGSVAHVSGWIGRGGMNGADKKC